MGLLGDLFDEGEAESTVETAPWGPLQDPLKYLIGESERLGQIPLSLYPDQMYVGWDPLQLQGMQAMESQLNRAIAPMETALSAWEGALMAPDVANNPYVQGMIAEQQRLLNRNLEENLLPSIAGRASTAGATGGSRQGIAEGLAARGTQEALANAMARTQLGAYGQGLSAQQGAFSAGPTILNTATAPATGLQRLGGQYAGMDQRALSEAMQRHQFGQMEPWQRMNMMAEIPVSLAGRFPQTTTTTPTPSWGDKLLGTATTLGSAFLGGGGNFSDFFGSGQFSGGAPTAPQPYYGGMNYGGGYSQPGIMNPGYLPW